VAAVSSPLFPLFQLQVPCEVWLGSSAPRSCFTVRCAEVNERDTSKTTASIVLFSVCSGNFKDARLVRPDTHTLLRRYLSPVPRKDQDRIKMFCTLPDVFSERLVPPGVPAANLSGESA
jgi:hypothetical protein